MTRQCEECGDADDWVIWSDWFGLWMHNGCEADAMRRDQADDELARRKEGEGL